MDKRLIQEPVRVEDFSERRESGDEQHSDIHLSGQDDSNTKWMPKRPTYPLNSKHIKARQLQQIAALLDCQRLGWQG